MLETVFNCILSYEADALGKWVTLWIQVSWHTGRLYASNIHNCLSTIKIASSLKKKSTCPSLCQSAYYCVYNLKIVCFLYKIMSDNYFHLWVQAQ